MSANGVTGATLPTDPPEAAVDPGKTKTSFWTLRKNKHDSAVDHPPFVPTLPAVNLVPASVKDAVAAQKLRRWFVLASLLLLAIVGGVWYLQATQISEAEAGLARAQAEHATLTNQQGQLAPVKQMYVEISRLQSVVGSGLASQPQAALVLDALNRAGEAAGGIVFDRADVSYTGLPAAGGTLNTCPNPNPFSQDLTIGCLSFSATAKSRDQVSKLLLLLEDEPFFVGPYVTNTTAQNENGAARISFTGSAGVSADALKTPLTDEELQALIAPPAPSASPTDEAEGQS